MDIGLSVSTGQGYAPPLMPVREVPRLSSPVSAQNFNRSIIGIQNNTSDPSRINMYQSLTYAVLTIKGTAAYLNLPFGNGESEPFLVVVDGVSSTPQRTGGVVTLFEGLADVEHVVFFGSVNPAQGFAYFETTGDVLTITGQDAYAVIPEYVAQVGEAAVGSAAMIRPHQKAGFAPLDTLHNPPQATAGMGSVAVRGTDIRKFYITSTAVNGGVGVSVDGGPLISLETDDDFGFATFDPPQGTHEFCFFSNESGQFAKVFAVASHDPFQVLDRPQLHHYGHSIVHGNFVGGPLYTDMPSTAVRNGYLSNCMGVSGRTIAQTRSIIDTVMGYVQVDAQDLAVLDLGQNDGDGAMSNQDRLDYTYIVNTLLSEGYGTVLCLSVMDDGSSPADFNNSLQNLIDVEINDVRVSYVDRSAYGLVTTGDGVHPTLAGYIEMNALNMIHLDSFIP